MESDKLEEALLEIKKLETEIAQKLIREKRKAEEEILKIRETGLERIHFCKKELVDEAQKKRQEARQIITLKVKELSEEAHKEREKIIRDAMGRSDMAVKVILERLLK